MAGLLGFGGDDEYKPKQILLDPEASQLIDQSGRDALKSHEELAQESLAGTEDARNMMPQDASGQVAMSGALSNKYRKMMQDDLDRIGVQQRYLARSRQANRLKQSAQMAQARQSIQVDNYKRLVDAYNAKRQARAQVLSSVLGLAGMVGGAAIGGPAGAMVGASMAGTLAPAPQAQPRQSRSYLGGDEMSSSMGNQQYMGG